MKPLRLLLADDHTLVRAGIRSLLEKLRGVTIVAEADDGREALRLAREHVPDVILMDISMPGLNGIEATYRLRKECPGARVVILSVHTNEEYILQAFKAGAAGYLVKKAAVAQLKAALQDVRAGRTFVCPTLPARLSSLVTAKAEVPASSREQLTARQREILQLIAESKSTKEIALLLGVSQKTVEFHRAGLMKRLGIHDVPGLVRHAMRIGLIPPEA